MVAAQEHFLNEHGHVNMITFYLGNPILKVTIELASEGNPYCCQRCRSLS